jgi:transglutaminase-like putative cysteine protease
MLIEIRHVTRYRYDQQARYNVQSLRLTPCALESQRIVAWEIKAPGIERAAKFRDGFGNTVHVTSLASPHDEVVIEASGLVETFDRAGVLKGYAEVAPTRVFMRETPLTEPDEAIRALAAGIKDADPIGRLHELMHTVREKVGYEIGATHARTTAAEALQRGSGVCQDHAHVFVSAARVLGYPARYVAGYFVAGDDPTCEASEAAHAWAEAFVPALGWIGFDAANGFCPTDRYVRVACGLDAQSAAPVRGSRSGGREETLDVVVEVQQQQQAQSQSQSLSASGQQQKQGGGQQQQAAARSK